MKPRVSRPVTPAPGFVAADEDPSRPSDKLNGLYSGDAWAQRLLNRLYEAAVQHQAEQGNKRDPSKPAKVERKGPRNPRDKLIFECLARGIPIPLVASYSLLTEGQITYKRTKWTEDGTLAAQVKLRRESSEILRTTFAEKAMIKLAQLLDNGSEEAQVQAAKALIATEDNAAARRTKTESDDKFIDAAESHSQRMLDALMSYKGHAVPANFERRLGRVERTKQLAVEVASDGESLRLKALDNALDAEYEDIHTGESP